MDYGGPLFKKRREKMKEYESQSTKQLLEVVVRALESITEILNSIKTR